VRGKRKRKQKRAKKKRENNGGSKIRQDCRVSRISRIKAQ
jgi:hypothetical protein